MGALVELYLNGVRENIGRTDETGSASFRMRRNLPVGIHTLEVRFEGSTDLLASRALATLEVVTPAPAVLIVGPQPPVPLGQRPTILARLLTQSGEPIANEPVEVYLNVERVRRTRTDATGTASLRVSRDLAPGTYAFEVVFPGSARFLESTVSTELVVEPAQLEVHTVPPLPGMQFSLDGRVFSADEAGNARILVDEPGTYSLVALPVDPGIPGVRVEFRRWESVFEPETEVEIPKDARLEVGYEVSHQVTLQFVDLDGSPVDPERVTSFTLKSSGGGVHIFHDAGPHWLPSARVIRTIFGIEQAELLYSLQDVVIGGANVVNRAQQRFTVERDDEWQVELLLYSLQLDAKDALFGFAVGRQIRLEYPDGSFERHALSPEGVLALESLPRGEYRAKAEGVLGISPVVPVALSRDQFASLKVISILDLALASVLSVTVALGLLFAGRPHLLPRLRALAPRLRSGWRRQDWAGHLPTLPASPFQSGRGVDWKGRLPSWNAPDLESVRSVDWKGRIPNWAAPAVQAVRRVKWMLAPDLCFLNRVPPAEVGPRPGQVEWGSARTIRPDRRMVVESNEPIPVLAIADQGPSQQRIAAALSDQSEFELVQLLHSREGLPQELLAAEPEIVILDQTLQGEATLDLIDDLALQFPEAAVVAIMNADDPAQLQQATLAGARGLLTQPIDPEDLMNTIRRVHELELRRRPVATAPTAGPVERADPLQVLTIYSPRGGTGVSTLAVNLAIALHEEAFEKVLLMDGKLLFGHLDVMLNLRAANSLADLIPHPNREDPEFVEQVVVQHRSGIDVLLSPADLQVAQGIRPEDLVNVLRAMRSQYGCVVVDAGSALTDNSLTLLDAADRLLLVSSPELPTLHEVTRFIRFSRTLGYPEDKGLVVLNRAGMAGAIDTADAHDFLGRELFALVPDDAGNATRALNRGHPLLLQSPRSPASKAIQRMARALVDAEGLEPGRESGPPATTPARASPHTVPARAG